MAKSDDLVKEGRDCFARCESAETDNRATYLEDVRFALEGKQWDDKIAKQREADRRPMLTINKLPAHIRQVVNDARQNKPSIKVHPVDDKADVETAEVINGLIRNIEVSSNADVAYDTATECAVTGGFGYIRVQADYSYEDGFEMDLSIHRVSNPLSIYGDPYSTEADSCDWNDAFVVDQITQDEFKKKYKDASQVDFSSAAWKEVGSSWMNVDAKMVTTAEWWKRRETEKKIALLSDGSVVAIEDLETPDYQVALQMQLVSVKAQRLAKCHEVTQYIMSGAEILETNKWPGRYIPIIPVYGHEFNIEGKRFFRSLIHNSLDAQRMYNYWRTTSTELVALAPRVPFIGKVGTFDSDPRWNSANTASHAYLEYKSEPPIRLPLDGGAAAGALQEALNASDDIKATTGLQDASLGVQSNETSGKAIMARQREGDVSTFNFPDNMARAIRHTGRVLIDLIPHYYNTERVIRILGEDGTQQSIPINQQYQKDPQTGQPVSAPAAEQQEQGPMGQEQSIQQAVMAMHDLRVGKYDLTVTTGPAFTTRRQEAAENMAAIIQAYPDAAPIVLPELAKNLDWPGADKIAEKFEAQSQGQVPPEVQQQMDQAAQQIDQLTQENQQLKQDQSAKQAELQMKAQSDQAAMQQQQMSDQAKLQQQQIADRSKLESQQQIEMLKIRSNEQLEMAKIAAEERIALAKARMQAAASIEVAKNKPKPTGALNG
jgi:hypothetical protein